MKNAKLYREFGKSEYMILTEWENTDSFSAFIQSRGFKETTTHGKTILEGQPKHKIFYDKI